MIGFIRGKVLDRTDATLTLFAGDTHEPGLGYQVTIPDRPDYLSLQTHAMAELYIHTHVREDALDLYGFLSREERRLFLLVTSISGIGPKLGLGLLTGLPPEELIAALVHKDTSALVAISGVGKKTAERLVLELSDKVSPWAKPSTSLQRSAPSSAQQKEDADIASAKEALKSLGFKENEAEKMVAQAAAAWNQVDRPSIESLVRAALRSKSP